MITPILLAASAALGAFIGFATNALAIKSLFRPLQPRWYTLGWQGVIPRNRQKLADNISRVVGEDLLGGDYLLEQVQSERMQENLHLFIGTRISRALDMDLAGVFSHMPPAWRVEGVEKLVHRGLEFAARWSEGEAGMELRKRLAEVLVERVRKQQLGQVLSDQQAGGLATALGAALGQSRTRDHLTRILQNQLEEYLGAERRLEELVPEDLRQLLHARLRQQVPAITTRVALWLQTPENVEHICERILLALESYADREGRWGRLLGELGLRLFREQIQSAIRERIPQVARDYLHSPETRKKVEEQLVGGVERFLSRSLGELSGGHQRVLAEKIGLVAGRWITSPEAQERLRALLLEAYRQREEKSLDALLPEEVWEQLQQGLLGALRIPPEQIPVWGPAIAGWLSRQLSQSHTPFREWAGLSLENEEALVEQVRKKATELLRSEVPVLLAQFDITELARARIMDFDLLRVERLIKDIISEQLRFINLLGAVLGAGVGLLLPFLNSWIAGF